MIGARSEGRARERRSRLNASRYPDRPVRASVIFRRGEFAASSSSRTTVANSFRSSHRARPEARSAPSEEERKVRGVLVVVEEHELAQNDPPAILLAPQQVAAPRSMLGAASAVHFE